MPPLATVAAPARRRFAARNRTRARLPDACGLACSARFTALGGPWSKCRTAPSCHATRIAPRHSTSPPPHPDLAPPAPAPCDGLAGGRTQDCGRGRRGRACEREGVVGEHVRDRVGAVPHRRWPRQREGRRAAPGRRTAEEPLRLGRRGAVLAPSSRRLVPSGHPSDPSLPRVPSQRVRAAAAPTPSSAKSTRRRTCALPTFLPPPRGRVLALLAPACKAAAASLLSRPHPRSPRRPRCSRRRAWWVQRTRVGSSSVHASRSGQMRILECAPLDKPLEAMATQLNPQRLIRGKMFFSSALFFERLLCHWIYSTGRTVHCVTCYKNPQHCF